jgi:predicted enzyme related to lactoylglutathione lyase
MAMAHWQLDHKEQAQKYYQQAVQWMEQDQSRMQDDELRRFRAEAEEVMGIKSGQ